MALEKSVSIVLPSISGKIGFARDGDGMAINVMDATGVVHDSATLTEADLRSLVKDLFPAKRKPREASVASAPNGSGRKRSGAAATA